LAAGFRRLRYTSAPANIHRASGAEEFASNICRPAAHYLLRAYRKITEIRMNWPPYIWRSCC
jgi:hypothetical protein